MPFLPDCHAQRYFAPGDTNVFAAPTKALERLGDLHQKGILSEDEFKSKKAELLSRL